MTFCNMCKQDKELGGYLAGFECCKDCLDNWKKSYKGKIEKVDLWNNEELNEK